MWSLWCLSGFLQSPIMRIRKCAFGLHYHLSAGVVDRMLYAYARLGSLLTFGFSLRGYRRAIWRTVRAHWRPVSLGPSRPLVCATDGDIKVLGGDVKWLSASREDYVIFHRSRTAEVSHPSWILLLFLISYSVLSLNGKACSLEAGNLGSSPSYAAFQPCDIWQFILPCKTSASSSTEWQSLH